MTVAARIHVRSVVDSAALRHNLARVRTLAPDARVLAVIKANAYGHGLVPVARALAGCDAFAVARLEEGLALRDAGVTQRVLLLEGVRTAEQLAQAGQHRLDVMVHCFEQIALLEARRAAAQTDAWLKVDTGMNRLGFRPEEFRAAIERLCRVPGIGQPPRLVTHFAKADFRDDPMTAAQLELFAGVTAGCPGERSIANSAGILAWPGARSEWARPGLMLYGLSPFADATGADFGLRPVMSFESEVIAVRDVLPGESVGYCATWRANRACRIAVVAAGYGDGYPRATATGAPVLIGGKRAPLVGRISMDMLTVDVTDLPSVRPGDAVTLWGEGLPAEEVARHAGAIPYELTCAVSQRVQHVVR